MLDTLADAAPKALISGTVVWLVIRSLDRTSPAVTAVVISLPMVLGAGFVALAAGQGDDFVARATLRAAQAMLGVLAYLIVVLALFERLSAAGLMAAGAVVWAGVSLLVTAGNQPWPLWLSLGAGAALIGLSHLIVPIRAGFSARQAGAGPRRRAWPVAMQAMLLVIILSMFAEILEPRLSAVLAAMPVATMLVTLDLKRSGNPAWSGTLQSVRLGLPCLYTYLVALALLLPALGAIPASWLAFLPAIAMSCLIVTARLKLT